MVSESSVSTDEVLVGVHGALHGAPATDFHTILERLIAGPPRSIVLDLSDVVSINSSSVGRILLTRKKLAEQGKSIRIEGCSDPVFSTFQLLRFDRLVQVRRQPATAQAESGLTR